MFIYGDHTDAEIAAYSKKSREESEKKWNDWKKRHPNTDAMNRRASNIRSYEISNALSNGGRYF